MSALAMTLVRTVVSPVAVRTCGVVIVACGPFSHPEGYRRVHVADVRCGRRVACPNDDAVPARGRRSPCVRVRGTPVTHDRPGHVFED